MKFLVDAQLPYRLTDWLKSQGFDAIHTTELPDKNLTQDFEIARIADDEDRIVITKDSDFFKLNLLKNSLQKLLFLTTGNIVNKELIELFTNNFEVAQKLFNSHRVIEMNNFLVVAHRN